MISPDEKAYTISEAARIMHRSEQAVRKLISRNLMSGSKPRKAWYILGSELKAAKARMDRRKGRRRG